MADTKENILIIGATGYIGGYITEQIVKAKDSFGRIAIFTSAGTADRKAKELGELKTKGLEIIVGDIENLADIGKAIEGITTVVSALGRTTLGAQVAWIPLLSKSTSVKRFFPSEYGTDIEYGPSSVNEAPHQQKLKVRAALKNVEGLEYTYVVTGPYADYRAYLGPALHAPEIGSYNIKTKSAVLLEDGKGKISLTTPNDVGKLVVKALLHPVPSRNRALIVNSFTTTPLEIVAEYEKQTGGEKWKISYTSLDKLRELEKKAWEETPDTATGHTLRRIWGEGGTLYETRDNGLIDGEDTETLEDAIRVGVEASQRS